MTVATDKNKKATLNSILAAAKKLSAEEKQLLKVNLFGEDIIREMKTFEAAMKKRKPAMKKSDEEIVGAVKKLRTKNAAK